MTWTSVNTFEKSAGVAQETYSPRFVAYLARFLVNYDRCAPCVLSVGGGLTREEVDTAAGSQICFVLPLVFACGRRTTTNRGRRRLPQQGFKRAFVRLVKRIVALASQKGAHGGTYCSANSYSSMS